MHRPSGGVPERCVVSAVPRLSAANSSMGAQFRAHTRLRSRRSDMDRKQPPSSVSPCAPGAARFPVLEPRGHLFSKITPMRPRCPYHILGPAGVPRLRPRRPSPPPPSFLSPTYRSDAHRVPSSVPFPGYPAKVPRHCFSNHGGQRDQHYHPGRPVLAPAPGPRAGQHVRCGPPGDVPRAHVSGRAVVEESAVADCALHITDCSASRFTSRIGTRVCTRTTL